jgi:hypothetical protein
MYQHTSYRGSRGMIYTRMRNTLQHTYQYTKYTTIISRPPGILHAYITRYWTPRRHLHSIHDTPLGNVVEHRLVHATYTIQ